MHKSITYLPVASILLAAVCMIDLYVLLYMKYVTIMYFEGLYMLKSIKSKYGAELHVAFDCCKVVCMYLVWYLLCCVCYTMYCSDKSLGTRTDGIWSRDKSRSQD